MAGPLGDRAGPVSGEDKERRAQERRDAAAAKKAEKAAEAAAKKAERCVAPSPSLSSPPPQNAPPPRSHSSAATDSGPHAYVHVRLCRQNASPLLVAPNAYDMDVLSGHRDRVRAEKAALKEAERIQKAANKAAARESRGLYPFSTYQP